MNGTRILIADDDFLAREMAKGLLELIGCKVVGEAATGVEAVEMVRQLRPDVVLMDIDMPEMNGFEATEQIHDGYLTPVIMWTGYDYSDVAEEAHLSGAAACLVKPPEAHHLKQALIKALTYKAVTPEKTL
jgi:response regulator NasT